MNYKINDNGYFVVKIEENDSKDSKDSKENQKYIIQTYTFLFDTHKEVLTFLKVRHHVFRNVPKSHVNLCNTH